MSGQGCSTPIGGELVCGQVYTFAPDLPLLCPACQRGRAALAAAGLPLTASEFATLRAAASDADLATFEERTDDGEPGSLCSPGCGYCGRCGGA